MERIPIRLAHGNKVRVMTSAPDLVVKGKAIAGVYPAGNAIVEELLSALSIRQMVLGQESDMHAFTALGVCLPIVLACWRGQGKAVDEKGLNVCAQRHSLGNFEKILEWALSAEPHFETRIEREACVMKAATPGGVTEAIIGRINAGGSLIQALESGIQRSEVLSMGVALKDISIRNDLK